MPTNRFARGGPTASAWGRERPKASVATQVSGNVSRKADASAAESRDASPAKRAALKEIAFARVRRNVDCLTRYLTGGFHVSTALGWSHEPFVVRALARLWGT